MDVLDCASSMIRALDARNIDTHSIEQLVAGLRQEFGRFQVDYEVRMADVVGRVVSDTGKGIDVTRIVDIVAESASRLVHTEIKTGYESIKAALKPDQLIQDAAIAVDHMRKQTEQTFENVWRITDQTFTEKGGAISEKAIAQIGDRMADLQAKLVKQGFNEDEIRNAIGSFNFVDEAGKAIRAELTEAGDLIFKDAAGNIFGPDGKLAQAATKESGDSPNFGPAMENVLGPDGKLAVAARSAADGVDLEPAFESLEEKVESGVTTALDEAGAKAEAHAAASLGSRVKEGVGALGGTLSAVGALGTSVIALGAAWDKPNKSAGDYFGLMSQLGGTISSGLSAVDSIQKLGAAMSNLGIITKIGAAAQAVFNAVMAVNPVVLIIIAVVALIAAIALLIVYWDQVKAAIRDNPWIGVAAVLLGIIAPIFGIIAAVIMLIAYWDEVKLAVLQGANFMSIQLQKIGGFFVGLKNLIGMVWDWIVASVYNLGAGIINGYIEFGGGIINFFVGLINDFIGIYNDLADVVPGLDKVAQVERVNVEAIKVATKEVPPIDVGKAFAQQGAITGGLEEQIVKQEAVVQKAQEEDKLRRDKKAQEKAEEEKAAAAAAPVGGVLPPGLPEGLPAGGALPAAAAVASGGGDQSIHVEGGIQISINAERLEADSATLLTDEIVRQLQERLDSLRSERDRRLGIRAPAAA